MFFPRFIFSLLFSSFTSRDDNNAQQNLAVHHREHLSARPPPCGTAQLPPSCEWPEVMPTWPTPDNSNNPLVDTSNLYLLKYPEAQSADDVNGTLYASCFMRNIRKPLFTMHRLDRQDVFGPCRDQTDCTRDSTFHNDNRFCYAEQDTNEYYYGSNFDRGHLTPNAAFGSEDQRLATFRLTNIVPQSSDRNRHAWEQLETYMRDFIDPGIRMEQFFSHRRPWHPHRKNLKNDTQTTYDTVYVYTGTAYTLPNAPAITYAPPEAPAKIMYFPLAMFKVAVCVNATENSAIVMACWSDNPNGAWPPVTNSSPLRIRGPYGEYVAECPIEQAQRRCVPWNDIGKTLLSDECFEPSAPYEKQWTVRDVLYSGLNWDAFVAAIKCTYATVSLDKTCF